MHSFSVNNMIGQPSKEIFTSTGVPKIYAKIRKQMKLTPVNKSFRIKTWGSMGPHLHKRVSTINTYKTDILTISGIEKYPNTYTIALGGVATGNI